MTISRTATLLSIIGPGSCTARAVQTQTPPVATWIATIVIGMNILALFLWFVVRVKKFDRGQAESPFGGESSSDQAFAAATAFIEENWNKPDLSRDAAARHLGLSSAYLNRTFRRQLGVSFAEYVDHVRVENSRERLEKTDDPVDNIASDCGYRTPVAFVRAFKARNGVTPSDYRRDRRMPPEADTTSRG